MRLDLRARIASGPCLAGSGGSCIRLVGIHANRARTVHRAASGKALSSGTRAIGVRKACGPVRIVGPRSTRRAAVVLGSISVRSKRFAGSAGTSMGHTGASVQGMAEGAGHARDARGIRLRGPSLKAKAGGAYLAVRLAGLRILAIVEITSSAGTAISIVRCRGRQYSLVPKSADLVQPRQTGLCPASGLVGTRGARFALRIDDRSPRLELLSGRTGSDTVRDTGCDGIVGGLKGTSSAGKAKVWFGCYGDQVAHTSGALVSA